MTTQEVIKSLSREELESAFTQREKQLEQVQASLDRVESALLQQHQLAQRLDAERDQLTRDNAALNHHHHETPLDTILP